ncbi:MAG: signal peptidase [Acidimicrobiaceae bacterium]|nr:signal peptidase [Acidimicrobiaceae bacterium]
MQERGPVSEVAASRRRLPARLVAAGAAAVVVVVLDQLTKTLAVRHLADGPVHLWWTLRLNLSYNSGAAFGLGRGVAPIVLVLGVVMVVLLVGLGRLATGGLVAAVALGLLVGGAVGNLADRLLRDNGGAVIDFIDLQWWPIFNVADMGITVGAALLVLSSRHDRA